MGDEHRLRAVVWDFDGTLVDTRRKNMAVNRRIVCEATGRPPSDFPALRSFAAYEEALRRARNWRELYNSAFGLNGERMLAAASRWTSVQLEDRTPAPVYGGIAEALQQLSGLPQAIVSQNAKPIIEAILGQERLLGHFRTIIGYQEVELDRQKPAPDGLLACLDQLTAMAPGVALYIGDHETDVVTAANANQALATAGQRLRVLSIAALFDGGHNGAEWRQRAEHVAETPQDVVRIVEQMERSASTP